MPLLDVDRVSKKYAVPGMKEPYCVFRDISLQIREGEFVSVIGHSGCGKSTLLNIIAGIDSADEGVIRLKGREVRSPGLDRMVVFQNFALMPWMTVYQNVRLAVQAAYPHWSRSRIHERVSHYLSGRQVSLGAFRRNEAALRPCPCLCRAASHDAA